LSALPFCPCALLKLRPSLFKDKTRGTETANQSPKKKVKTFNPLETLHLIPESDMRATSPDFPQYAYCRLADLKKHKPDENLQFVAVITSKAVVAKSGARLNWSVADKSGCVCFPPQTFFCFLQALLVVLAFFHDIRL
jgi:hypothetical protein